MKNKRKELLLLLILIYAISTIIAAYYLLTDPMFGFVSAMLDGNIYVIFVILYHIVMISGSLWLIFKKKLEVSNHVILAIGLFIAGARVIEYLIYTAILMRGYRISARAILSRTVENPGILLTTILLTIIVLLLYASSKDSDNKEA